MLDFIREVRRLLPQSARRRLTFGSVYACGLAAIDAASIALVVPLVRSIDALGADVTPSELDRWIELAGAGGPSDLALRLGVVVFLGFALKGVLGVLYVRWNLRYLMHLEAETAGRLLGAYLDAPYTFHLTRNSADLQRTIHLALRQIYREAMVGLVGGAADVVVIAAIAVVLVVSQPVAAVSAALYFALVALGYQRLIHGRTAAAAASVHDDAARAYKLVQQSVGAAKELAINGRQGYFVEEFQVTEKGLADRQATLLFLSQLPRYYLEIALVAGVAIMSIAVFSTSGSDAGATATLGLFLIAGFRVLPSLNRVLVAVASMRAGLPALRQVLSDLDELDFAHAQRARIPEAAPTTSPRLDPSIIELRDVSFRYTDDGPLVLAGVNLEIHRGQSIAFVGSSGAGKTTLVDLLLGVLDPTDGSIELDGQAISSVWGRWRESVGYVPQVISLLDSTLRANIAFGISEIDDHRLESVVEQAQLGDLVRSLPDGLETVIGEAGARLSGGQRQRIGIARALYTRPSVMVLDEATSALDSETEASITATIDSLRGAMTVVVIAHRLATIRACDRIYLLDDGVIVAGGSFTELQDREPRFERLVHLSQLGTD